MTSPLLPRLRTGKRERLGTRLAWRIREQLQKTSGADVFFVEEKIQKNLRPPPPPPCTSVHPRVKIIMPSFFFKHYRKTVFDPRQETNFFLYIKYKEKSFNEKTFCKNNRTAPMLKSRKFHSWFWLHDSLFSRVCLLIHLLRQKKYSLGLIPKHGVSTSARKSPLQLKEWFCVVDLNLEKMKLMMQTHL